MKYNSIRSMDISNGEGVGIALFVQGCHFHCPSCFNQDTWDFNGGKEWTKSPVNLAQYVVENDNQIKVFLNPAAIIAAVNNAGRAIDVQTVIQQAIQILYPMLVNGVPVAFEQTEDALSVYLNTELLLPLLKTLVVPLLSDEEVVAMLVELMKKDPDFGEMAGLAEPMLKAFPEIIESTTKVEIGLNFVK